MQRRSLMDMFSEGQSFDLNIPCTLILEGKEVDDNEERENYFYTSIEINPNWLDKISEIDEDFADGLVLRVDSGIHPEAILQLVPKEKAKIKARYKKELQAKIKALQSELDSL